MKILKINSFDIKEIFNPSLKKIRLNLKLNDKSVAKANGYLNKKTLQNTKEETFSNLKI
jgi:hypothetical protein